MSIIAIILLFIAFCGVTALYFRQMNATSAANTMLAAAEEKILNLNSTVQKADARIGELSQTIEQLNRQIDLLKDQLADQKQSTALAEYEVNRLRTKIDEERESNRKREQEIEEQRQQLARQTEANFKVMANEIMAKHSETLREQNDRRIGEILTPLRENIDEFRKQINECYSTEARERFSLEQRIKELVEANNNIGREAKELSAALRGNSKKQGDWGELVLENILENSGLRKGEEFTVQQQTADDGTAMHDENGRGLRPDVIVHCPDGKIMVIDSKVSLTAFTDYVNEEDPERQQQLGKLHLQSIKKHIAELSEKNYQDYFGKEKLDFVMMFIPNEGAYSAALTLDPTIWQKAYDKRVLIVSPTQLVGSLRIIHQLWSHDRQTRNAIEIADKSGKMYDKFVSFVTDMEKIEKSLNATQSIYGEAMKKLRDGRGSLIDRAGNLRELGIKASKRLNQV